MNFVFNNGVYNNFFISNSLHKLCHNGYNYTDFNLSELRNTIAYVSDTLNVDFSSSLLTGANEFSVNIEVKDVDLYSNFLTPTGSIRQEMIEGKEKYGIKFRRTKYDFKAYDPIKKLFLDKNSITPSETKKLLRLELVCQVSYLRQRGIKVSTVADLTNKDFLKKIGDVLIKKTSEIKYRFAIPNTLKAQELQVYNLFAFSSKENLDYIKRTQKSTYERKVIKYEEIRMKYQKENVVSEISKKVKNKWIELMDT